MNEDRSARYQRLKRRVSVASVLWTAAFFVALVVTGSHLRLRDLSERLLPAAPVVGYVALLSILNEAGGLPLAFYGGFVLERRYGLSKERFRAWAIDQAKSYAVGFILGAGAVSVIYWFLARSPNSWWLQAGAVFALIVVGLTNLAPVLLLPIFYTVKPLDRADLRARLLALAERAGARVLGAYEWGLGAKTTKANAALAGLGGTRRILVSDTMLADYSEEEIEVVLAHELAHHVHGDIWKGIAFESGLILAGFYAASWALTISVSVFGLRGVDDVAGLPILLLAAGAVSLALVPLAHAMSRAFERRADRFALALTRNPGAFVSAMRRLGAQNLAEEEPSKIVEWLFCSHPPMRDRITAAETFKP